MAFPTSTAHRLATFVAAQRRWVVLAMLLALHAALVAEQGGAFQRIWLLVHFGFFLLWQPFIAAERELELLSAVLLTAITGVTLYFLAGWLIVMWLLLLLGILGGRVFTIQAARRGRFYLAAFGYVLAILLLWAVPTLILGAQELPEAIARFATTYLPFVLVLLVFLPMSSENESVQVFDFFYAVLVFQLGLVLVLGSLVTMRYTDDDYVNSVVLSVLAFAAALFILAVFWNPTRGFGGLRTYFSTYLLSVGMPFELWMRRIAELAETEPDSGRFLEQALGEVASLPWMRGANWRSPDGEGSFGDATGYATRFAYHDLELVFRTEDSLSPALFLHMRLLAQVVGEFYEGKRRENELRRNAYLQAVHETGARLTHDVKNLLQSLYALTSMAPKTEADGYDGLLQRQLPQLTKRLNATLEKLREPEVATLELPVPAHAWWAELERRLAGSPVTLQGTIALERDVPGALFDSFVENGLENARAKAGPDGTVGMRVDFSCSERGVELSVVDSGSPVPAAVTRKLFREPIERSGGLGIGLYNAARQATRAGYTLLLADNREGNVCFRLRRAASAESAQRQD